jgi:squalene-hopene/tetraprenyl-beta-curcumene cyclase
LAWNTALVAGDCGWARDQGSGEDALAPRETLDWLLDQQWRQWDCRQGALPGGWSRFARGAGRPTADATSVVLSALGAWCERRPAANDDEVRQAAQLGCEWLLAHQRGDGGWAADKDATGTLACEPSAVDVTARAWRALERWRRDPLLARDGYPLARRLEEACRRAGDNVAALQDADGSWRPRWLGSPGAADEANRVLGTALALQAFAAAGRTTEEAARRGAIWLADVQYAGGSWGPPPVKRKRKHEFRSEAPVEAEGGGSIEETAAATAALAPFAEYSDKAAQAVRLGAEWLCAVVLEDDEPAASPLGFDFAELWYYDECAPWISAAGALAQLVRASAARDAARPLVLPQPQSAATLP